MEDESLYSKKRLFSTYIQTSNANSEIFDEEKNKKRKLDVDISSIPEIEISSLKEAKTEPPEDIFTIIPDPVWQQIFSYFNYDILEDRLDLGIFRLVSKKFRMLVAPFWKQKVRLRDLEEYIHDIDYLKLPTEVLEVWVKPSLYLDSLFFLASEKEKEMVPFPEDFATTFSNLKSLKLYDQINNDVMRCLPPNLVSLDLSSLRSSELSHYPPFLQKLTVGTICSGRLSHLPNTLKELTICDFESSLDGIYNSFPSNLEKLSINGKGFFGNNYLENLPSSITHLTLNYCSISDEGIKFLPSGLKVFEIRSNIDITNSGLSYLPKSLTSLHLFQSYSISDQGLKNLNLPCLKLLELHQMHGIRGEGFQYLTPDLTMRVGDSLSTPFLASVSYCNINSVKYFIDHGVDVNQTKNGKSALHIACEQSELEIALLLLNSGANSAQLREWDQASPLLISILNGFSSIIPLLLSYKESCVNKTDKYGITPLHLACEKGKIELVKNLILHGAIINLDCEKIESPIVVACQQGFTNIVEILIGHGGDVNLGQKNFPLVTVCDKGFTDLVELLINHGADVNKQRIEDGATPLFIACYKGYTDIVKILLDNGADLNCVCQGSTSLYVASNKGFTDILKLLILYGANINEGCNSYGSSPLFLACLQGFTNIAELLINSGADVNLGCKNNGSTPLYIASQNGFSDIVDLLLENGANPNQGRSDDGETPLLIAIWKGYSSIIHILLEREADINQPDKYGFFPLHIATKKGNLELIQLLVSLKCNPKTCFSRDGETALYLAADRGFFKVVEYFLRLGMDVNQTRRLDGTSPLFAACQINNSKIVKLLLRNGADPNIVRILDGKTPLHRICRKIQNKPENKTLQTIFDQLLIYGANPNIAEMYGGMNALHLCCKNGYLEGVVKLIRYGVNVNARRSKDGATPLFLAAKKGFRGILNFLLEQGADPTISCYPKLENSEKMNPLSIAKLSGDKKIEKILLNYLLNKT